MRVLAISGSLRAQSTNRQLLELFRSVVQAAQGSSFVLFEDLAAIPPFNPDLEAMANDGPVLRLRQLIGNADAVVISTPEYAHGIPGALKNAIDWLVGTGELYRKPVMLVQANTHSTYVLAALKEVLGAVDARLLREAEVLVDLKTTPSSEVRQTLEAGFESLVRALSLPPS